MISTIHLAARDEISVRANVTCVLGTFRTVIHVRLIPGAMRVTTKQIPIIFCVEEERQASSGELNTGSYRSSLITPLHKLKSNK